VHTTTTEFKHTHTHTHTHAHAYAHTHTHAHAHTHTHTHNVHTFNTYWINIRFVERELDFNLTDYPVDGQLITRCRIIHTHTHTYKTLLYIRIEKPFRIEMKTLTAA